MCHFHPDLEGGKFFFNTVREGDSNLITRLESPKLGKMEMIREFSKDGMVLVRTKIFLKTIFSEN